MIKEEVQKFEQEIVQELKRIMEEKIGKEGITTLKGERGYTPVPGIDFLTPEMMAQIKDDLRPVKGRDYFDGQPGLNGRSPSFKETQFVISRELSKKKFPKNFNFDPQSAAAQIARALEKLQGENRLDYEALKNRPGVPAFGRKRYGGRGGGGGINELTATGTVNGANTVFSFTQEPNFIVSDGIWYRKNAGWTWSFPNATLTIAPTYSIFGIG